MKEFKGTKGEWVNTIGTFEDDLHLVSSSNGIICDIRKSLPLNEQEANAKLISSAPELLEALKPFAELLKQFDGSVGNRPKNGIIQAWHHNSYGENQLTVEMLKKAKQAINKALGDD